MNKNIKLALKHLPEIKTSFYYEPFSPKLIFNLEKHNYEAIWEGNPRILVMWEAIRNETKEFLSKLKTIKYSLKTMEKHKKKLIDPESGYYQEAEDYFETGFSEFIIKNMTSKSNWTKQCKFLINNADRIKDCYFISGDLAPTLKSFSGEQTFIYWEEPEGVELPREKYGAFFEKIYKGKALIIGNEENKGIYKTKFANWKKIKEEDAFGWKNY